MAWKRGYSALGGVAVVCVIVITMLLVHSTVSAPSLLTASTASTGIATEPISQTSTEPATQSSVEAPPTPLVDDPPAAAVPRLPRYISYRINYPGRLNNQRFCFRNALFLARVLNRTLLVEPWEEHLSWHDPKFSTTPYVIQPVQKYLDMELLNRVHPSIARMEFNATGLSSADVTGLLGVLNVERTHKPGTTQDVLSRLGNRKEDILVVNKMFPLRLDPGPEVINSLMGYVRPPLPIRVIAHDFLASLQGPTFAVHLRHFENSCGHWERTLGLPRLECEQPLETLIKTIDGTGFKFNTLVLLSDGQTPSLDAGLMKHYEGHVTKYLFKPGLGRDLNSTEISEYGMIDGEIACQADFFMGSWFSTFSRMAQMYREARNLPYATLGGKARSLFW